MKMNVQPTSCFHIKMVHLYPGVHPDDLYDCLTTEVRVNWDSQDVFEVIETDAKNGAHVIHQTFKKPPTDKVQQRDLVYKFYARKNYLKSEEHGSVHIFAS